MSEVNGTKFCKFCGQAIPDDAIICTHCGRQVEEIKGNSSAKSNVVINNTNVNTVGGGKPKDKIVAILLCFFLGAFGAHKFYEGKIGMGILYLFTVGLFGIGTLVDFIKLLFKPNPYYV